MATHAPTDPSADAHPAGPATDVPPLRVMSFNALFATDATTEADPGHWPRRAPAIEALLAGERPHLVGLQEMQEHTFTPVERGLGPSYSRLGTATRGGSDGLINPILFDTDRLELMAWNQFWLSDRPREIGSATWGNAGPRVAVWARFRDRVTGGELVHLNTHLDHVITQAKIKGAQLIADHLRQFHLLHLPALVTGDFNSVAGDSPAYEVLVEDFGMQDTWLDAAERTTPGWSTFPHFGEVEESPFRIDWILASPGVEVLEASINATRPGGVFPSDHLPVQATVRVPRSGS